MNNDEARHDLEVAAGAAQDTASRLNKCVKDIDTYVSDVRLYQLTLTQRSVRRDKIIGDAALDGVSLTSWDGKPAPAPPEPPGN